MENEILVWLKRAEEDLGVARHLMESYYPHPLEIICYLCQQSAEKAIKAVIIENGAPGGLPKVHNLSFLLQQIKNVVSVDEKYYEYADTLTPYGVTARYPNELFLEEHHAKTALNYAQEILHWAKNTLSKED